MTAISVILAIIAGTFSYFFFLLEWIELNCYVKTKDNSIFDSNENHPDERLKEYYCIRNSFNFSEEEK